MSIVLMSQLSTSDCRELGNNILPRRKSRVARRWLRDPRWLDRLHHKPRVIPAP
ncbi:MAG: hypothetical protein FWD61_13170 [Phycisphaerales bacterium]|nr:hypothetical protein [Phycisphaerales bacterium]